MALGFVGDDSRVDGLTRTIEAAVGQHIVGILRRRVVVERIIAVDPLLGTGFVRVGIDEIRFGTLFREVVDGFALRVGRQRFLSIAAIAGV